MPSCVCGWRLTRAYKNISVSLHMAPRRSGTINNLQASAKPPASLWAYFSQECNSKSLVLNHFSLSSSAECMCQLMAYLFCPSNPVYSHTYTATSGVSHLTHTREVWKGEFWIYKFHSYFLLAVYLYMDFQKCWIFFRNQTRISGVSSLLCESAHVGNHSHNTKKDFLYSFFAKDEISRGCGNSSQIFTLHWFLVEGWPARCAHWKSNDIELCFRVIWKLNTFLRNCFCSDCQFSAWEVYDQIVSGRSFLLGSVNCWFSEDTC